MIDQNNVNLLLDTFSKSAALLKIGFIDITETSEDTQKSISNKTYTDTFPFVNTEVLVEKEEVIKNKDSTLTLMVQSENNTIHCLLIPLIMEKNIDGYVIAQKHTPFEEIPTELLTFIKDVAGIISLAQIAQSSNQKYKDELINMRNMQAKLFPKFNTVKELDIASIYLPVELMSGNFLDARHLDENTYQIVACDVTGYDASSTFTGAAIRTLVTSFSSKKMVPSALVELIMDRLKKMISGIHALIYLTVYQIDTSNGRVRVSSFGDVNTIYYSGKQKKLADLSKTQIGQDLSKRNMAKDIFFTLEPGDAILYYSNGAIHATTEDGSSQYGLGKLAQHYLANIESPSIELAHEIADTIYEFTNYSPLEEDILMVCIKRM